MRLILNVIWLVFGGLWLALGYLLAALICFVLIVTIPFGFASLRIASYALWPFGRTIVDKPGTAPGRADRQHHLGRAVRLVAGARPSRQRGAMAVTIIGIPLAIADLKLIPVSLLPLGKEIVPTDQARQVSPPYTSDLGHDADRSGPAHRGAARLPGPDGRSAGRHLRPRRHRSAGVVDRPLQPSLHLLHARRRPRLAAG